MLKDIAIKILVALPPKALDVAIAVTDPILDHVEASPFPSLTAGLRDVLNEAVDRKLAKMLAEGWRVASPKAGPSFDTPQPADPAPPPKKEEPATAEVNASEYFRDAAKLAKREFCTKYKEPVYCRHCAAHDRRIELLWISSTEANCPACGRGAEWPRPASELYPDKPWKCPRCGGEVREHANAEGVAEWHCVGVNDTKPGHEHAEHIYGKIGADGLWVSGALPRERCEWHDTADNYGKTWR